MRFHVVLFAVSIAGWPLGSPLLADVAPSSELRHRLELDGRVSVFVALDDGFGPFSVLNGGSRPGEPATPSLAQRKEAYRRCQDECLAAIEGSDVRVLYRYRYSPVLAVELPTLESLELVEGLEGTRAIGLNREGHVALDQSREVVHANEVYALGYRGEGTVVSVIDTGVDSDHPDVEGKLLWEHARHFLNEGETTGPGAEDDHGHGSNVTGIICSSGIVAPRGIAPDARILPIKAINRFGSGKFADWAAALEHTLAVHEEDNGVEIDLINMSIQSGATFLDVCDEEKDFVAIHAAVLAARELGIITVAAAGNNRSRTEISMPACLTPVISVSSVLDDAPTEIHNLSNRGQLVDFCAPGHSITSMGLDGGVRTIGGTSQATPHVTATAAILLGMDPTLTPDEVVSILSDTAIPFHDPESDREYLRIDSLASVSCLAVGHLEGFSCEFRDSSRAIVASWHAPEGAESIRLGVTRSGEEVRTWILDPSRTGFVLENLPEGEYRVEAFARSDSLDGPQSTCALTIAAPDERFRRGDCDGDGELVLADPVALLNRLFREDGSEPGCLRACDSNDDDAVDIADAVFSLLSLFLQGPPPAAPHPDCGADPTLGPSVVACVEPHCD